MGALHRAPCRCLMSDTAATTVPGPLAGDADAQTALRHKGATEKIPSPDFVPPADEFLVLDADASQSYVINAVLAGKNLIIKGPPEAG